MDYFSHTIRITNFSYDDIYHLENILKKGYLLSRRRISPEIREELNLSLDNSLYNGMNHISLCDLSSNHDNYSAYNIFVKKGLSLLFNKEINATKPRIIPNSVSNLFFIKKNNEIDDCFSDLSDEFQVKDELSLKYLEGLLLSIRTFYDYHNEIYLLEYINMLKNILNKYKYNIPIINLDTENEIIIEKNKVKII